MNLPTVIKSDSSLNELYQILGIMELTPSLAVKKFILPTLNQVGIECVCVCMCVCVCVCVCVLIDLLDV